MANTPDDPVAILAKCLDIAEALIAEGREAEALEYLKSRVLPAIAELAEAAQQQQRR